MRKRLIAVLIGIVFVLAAIGCYLIYRNAVRDGNANQKVNPSSKMQEIQKEEQQDKKEFQVTFYANDGTLLLVDMVEPGENATPPTAPIMPVGYIFSHWDKDFTNVQADLEIYAVCTEVPQNGNVLAMESASGGVGSKVTLPLRLTGEVCIAGFDVSISYDISCLEFVEMAYEDDSVLSNVVAEKGQIYLNYLSTNNTTGEVDLCDIVFRMIGQEGNTTVNITIESAVAVDEHEQFYTPECQVINATVTMQK